MITVNLPDALEDAAFYTMDPFTIYEFENLLEDDFYQQLVDDVRSRDEFDRVFKGKGDKRKYSLTGRNFDATDPSPFSKFAEYFLSRDFFDWFERTHLSRYDTARKPHYVYNKKSSDFKKLQAANETGLVALTFRSLNSFMRPFAQMPRDFCHPAMNGGGADCRTH